MKNVSRYMAFAALSLSLTACLNSNEYDKLVLDKVLIQTDIKSIQLNNELQPQEKAEAIAKEAEKLANPTSFMFADKVAKLALSYDANNFRAQLLVKTLSPQMKMKGAVERSSDIFNRTTIGQERKAALVAKAGSNQSLKDFLFDAETRDLQSEADIQKMLKEITKEYEALRVFISKNKDKKILLNGYHLDAQPRTVTVETSKSTFETKLLKVSKYNDKDSYSFEDKGDRYISTYLADKENFAMAACNTRISNDGEYQVVCHESIDLKVEKIGLTRPDLEFLEQAAAAQVINLLVANAYNLDGSISVAEEVSDENSSALARSLKMSSSRERAEKTLELALEKNSLGTDRNLKDLAYINKLGANAIPALKLASQNRTRWCPRGFSEEDQRKGFLLSNGACLSERLISNVIAEISNSLKSGITKTDIENKYLNEKMDLEIDTQKFITGQVKNLKAIGPKINDEGRLVVADESLGGVLKSGQANKVYKLLSYSAEDFREDQYRKYLEEQANARANKKK